MNLPSLAALLVSFALVTPAAAQTIKLGELNSYKVFPAFLEPYKKGMELAIDEVNAGGGVFPQLVKGFREEGFVQVMCQGGEPHSRLPF